MEEFMIPKLKGVCFACERDAARLASVGPLVITIKDPWFCGGETIEHTFCCWECIVDYFQVQAGRMSPVRLKAYCKDAGTA
jgi:hypothetical protein